MSNQILIPNCNRNAGMECCVIVESIGMGFFFGGGGGG